MEDCSFYYFKPSGKWKYEGRGRFPRPPERGGYYEVDHDAIRRENGSMPGLTEGSDAKHMTIVVIPDENCAVATSYPRMIKAERIE